MACEYCKFSIPGYVAKGAGIGGMCPTELYRLCESGEAAKKVRGVGLKKQGVIAEELRLPITRDAAADTMTWTGSRR